MAHTPEPTSDSTASSSTSTQSPQIIEMDQGLLARNPALTFQEFSDHWYHKHSQLVVPFFLHSGVKHYEQIHGPISSNTSSPVTSTTSTNPINLSIYSGICGLPPQSVLDTMTFPKWKQAYYDEVIKVDERRFLAGEALDVFVRVPPGSVKGDRRVVIEDGKVLVPVEEKVWEVWRGYERRGGEAKKVIIGEEERG